MSSIQPTKNTIYCTHIYTVNNTYMFISVHQTKHCKTRHFNKTLGSKMNVWWAQFPIRRDVWHLATDVSFQSVEYFVIFCPSTVRRPWISSFCISMLRICRSLVSQSHINCSSLHTQLFLMSSRTRRKYKRFFHRLGSCNRVPAFYFARPGGVPCRCRANHLWWCRLRPLRQWGGHLPCGRSVCWLVLLLPDRHGLVGGELLKFGLVLSKQGPTAFILIQSSSLGVSGKASHGSMRQ